MGLIRKKLGKVKRDIKERIYWNTAYLKLLLEEKKIKPMIILVMTPEHGNVGDQAIVLGTYQFLKDIGLDGKVLEIPASLFDRKIVKFKKIIGDKMIAVHGGGYLGTLWPREEKRIRNIIKSFPGNKIVVFPQTIFFEDTEFGRKEKKITQKIYDNHVNLTLCLRERESYELAKVIFNNIKILLIPDMVPYLSAIPKQCDKKGAALCMRSDKERVLKKQDKIKLENMLLKYFPKEDITYMDTIVEHDIAIKDREKEVGEKIAEIAGKKIIITDRLHGMVFSALALTPCIALGNCNYKIKGVYRWISNNKYITFVENIEDVAGKLEELLDLKDIVYENKDLKIYYDRLKTEILKV